MREYIVLSDDDIHDLTNGKELRNFITLSWSVNKIGIFWPRAN